MKTKESEGFSGIGRDEAAAKNEDHEGFHWEKQIKRKNGCRELMVGYGAVGCRLRESVAPTGMGKHHAAVI